MKFQRKEMQKLLETIGDIAEGETINTFHCKEGNNNDRLYITNKGDVYVFYCHHCQSRGALPVSRAAYKRAVRGAKECYHHSYMLPSDALTEPSKWPVEALKWPLSAGLTFSEMAGLNLQYSKKLDRVCIPISYSGQYRGFLARRVGKEGPKYLARQNDRDNFIFHKHVTDNNIIVIVEDVLSAYKISKAGYNTLALMGTHLTDSMLSLVSSNYNNYIIWMDNDNPDVKLAQASVKKQLGLYGGVRIVKTNSDPKSYTTDEIKSILK